MRKLWFLVPSLCPVCVEQQGGESGAVFRGRHNHPHADTGNWLSGPSRASGTHHYPAVCSALALVLLTSLHQATSLYCPSCCEPSADEGLCSLLSGAVPNAVPHGSWGVADNRAMVLQNGQQKQGQKNQVSAAALQGLHALASYISPDGTHTCLGVRDMTDCAVRDDSVPP